MVSDRGIEKSGNLDKILKILDGVDGLEYQVFKDVEAEPSIYTARKVIDIVRSGIDLVIGLGGGSVLDVSKLGGINDW